MAMRRGLAWSLWGTFVQRGRCLSTGRPAPLKSILIANRGEIALRVGRTASDSGIRTTVLFTDPDATSQHALSSPFAINLGDSSKYLDGDAIIGAALKNQCQAIHPGYGFLSENAPFAKKCTEAGLNFIGPPWKAIEAMGDKSRSKELMIAAGVPCIPGYHGPNQDPAFLEDQAQQIGYPVLIKAVKGGGGKGMRIVSSSEHFASQLESAKTEARNSFGDDVMLVEKYITTPRHVEVQVFADKHGNCVALGERDCSIQRRHQKILEESPAPNLPEAVRLDFWEKARAAALAVGYEGAGTVEFILDNDTGNFFFMEMNTRLQVEHPVTEMVTGQDLVQWQILVAEGARLPLSQEEVHQRIRQSGHAIEARIYAENPDMNFVPDSGTLLHLRTPDLSESVRIDAGFAAGDIVSSHYDPMIAKLIVRGSDREEALQKLKGALESYEIAGPVTNIDFLGRLCGSPAFIEGQVETGYIGKHGDELFASRNMENEVWVQAALFFYLCTNDASNICMPSHQQQCSQLGFGSSINATSLNIAELPTSTDAVKASNQVVIGRTAEDLFMITMGTASAMLVKSAFEPSSKTLRTFFPHCRIESRCVYDAINNVLHVFQRGQQYRLQLQTPRWAEKALGMKDVTNSVLSPMPCKVLRVDVEPGAQVKKNQPLVVIESMKMETVIRAPHDGVVARVIHQAGDLCKAGTALVEFEAES